MNITGDIIVGLFTLLGAIIGVFFTYRYNLKIEEKHKEYQINAILQSIYEEISVTWDRYLQMAGELLKNLKEDQVLNFYDILDSQDFVVYNTNAYLIGQIKDSNLRKNIVKFYTLSKGFSNTIIYTNKINLKYQDYLTQNFNNHVTIVDNTYKNYLSGFMKELKVQHNQLECTFKNLKDLLENHEKL